MVEKLLKGGFGGHWSAPKVIYRWVNRGTPIGARTKYQVERVGSGGTPIGACAHYAVPPGRAPIGAAPLLYMVKSARPDRAPISIPVTNCWADGTGGKFGKGWQESAKAAKPHEVSLQSNK